MKSGVTLRLAATVFLTLLVAACDGGRSDVFCAAGKGAHLSVAAIDRNTGATLENIDVSRDGTVLAHNPVDRKGPSVIANNCIGAMRDATFTDEEIRVVLKALN